MDVRSGKLVSQYRKRAWDSFIPINATIELSVSCNFKCLHCYNFDRSKPLSPHIKKNELSDDEVFKTITSLKKLGSIYLAFTGGEPLLHPSIDKYIKYAKTEGFIVRIKTNGLLLSKRRCQELKELGVSLIDISIYGASHESYQSFTQTNNSSNKIFEGLKNAVNAGIHTTGNIVVHKMNFKELPIMRELVLKAGAECAHSDEITERYTDKKQSPKNMVELDNDDYDYIFNSDLKEYFVVENETFSAQCACARTNIGISSQGDIYPCIGAPISAGNIRNENLMEVWKKSKVLNGIRELKPKDFKECTACEFKLNCQRSSGAIYTNTMNYSGCDESTLRLSKIRNKYSTKTS